MNLRRSLARLAAISGLAAATVAGLAPAASACSDCPINLFSDVSTAAGVQISGTYQPVVGNFDGDHGDDILWYAPGSTPDAMWLGTPTHGVFTKSTLHVSGLYIPIVGNFAGDSYDDILWYAPGTGADTLWTSVGGPGIFASSSITINGSYTPAVLHDETVSPVAVPAAGPSVVRPHVMTAPYDRIVWSAAAPAADSLWSFSFSSHTGHAISISGTPKLVPLQINADGLEDFIAYSPGSGPDAIYRSNDSGGFDRSTTSINGTYTPVVVGYAPTFQSVLWFGPGSATDSLWVNDGGGILSAHATQPVSVSGAIVSSNGYGYLYDSSGVDKIYDLGYVRDSDSVDIGAGAHPFAGDFDNNGRADIFFYRAGSATDSLGYAYS